MPPLTLPAGARLGPYEILAPLGALPARRAIAHAIQIANGLARQKTDTARS